MSIELGEALLRLARNAIASRFGLPSRDAPDHPALDEPGATFVTLTQAGQLRGCIGTLEAYRHLGQDVQENALAAAFCDPRFHPLGQDELPRTRIEVSLLTAPEPFGFRDEADALAKLRPGIDGLILTHEGHRATFLPQVWESLPDARRFMAELKRKAGLPGDFWDEKVALARYGVTKWKEPEPQWA
ncbi:MAG: AmmeMemoRadiSam system protein A [Rhodocyclaceae bacterium]